MWISVFEARPVCRKIFKTKHEKHWSALLHRREDKEYLITQGVGGDR